MSWVKAIVWGMGFCISFSFATAAEKTCDCANQTWKGDSLIFYGKVLDITTNNVASGIKATLGISKIFKGNTDPVTVVSTDYPGERCGFPFEKDSFYLVYAFKGRSIKTSTCLATQKVSSAAELPASLGLGVEAHRDTDKIYSGILQMTLATIGGFLLLIGILFWRKRLKN